MKSLTMFDLCCICHNLCTRKEGCLWLHCYQHKYNVASWLTFVFINTCHALKKALLLSTNLLIATCFNLCMSSGTLDSLNSMIKVFNAKFYVTYCAFWSMCIMCYKCSATCWIWWPALLSLSSSPDSQYLPFFAGRYECSVGYILDLWSLSMPVSTEVQEHVISTLMINWSSITSRNYQPMCLEDNVSTLQICSTLSALSIHSPTRLPESKCVTSLSTLSIASQSSG